MADVRQHPARFIVLACRIPDGRFADFPSEYAFLRGRFSLTAHITDAKTWPTLKEAKTAANRFASRFRCHAMPLSHGIAWAMTHGGARIWATQTNLKISI